MLKLLFLLLPLSLAPMASANSELENFLKPLKLAEVEMAKYEAETEELILKWISTNNCQYGGYLDRLVAKKQLKASERVLIGNLMERMEIFDLGQEIALASGELMGELRDQFTLIQLGDPGLQALALQQARTLQQALSLPNFNHCLELKAWKKYRFKLKAKPLSLRRWERSLGDYERERKIFKKGVRRLKALGASQEERELLITPF